MASLQQGFTYEGNVSASPVNSVNLNFKIPAFEFITVLRDGKRFPERNHVGEQIVHVKNKLNSDSYEVNFQNQILVGHSNTSLLNFYSYFSRINFRGDDAQSLYSLTED